jgi:hypothetical protein
MSFRDFARLILPIVGIGFAAPAPSARDLPAIKVDVLCRGLGDAEKTRLLAQWCDGYARGVIETLRYTVRTRRWADREVCVPETPRALFSALGKAIGPNPSARGAPAVEVLLGRLEAGPPC